MSDWIRYFAYGSNLCVPRLRFRVPGVEVIGAAQLPGFELNWHKRSDDQSGKCSISPRSAALVHGALFSIPADEMHRLDLVEGLGHGYNKQKITVTRDGVDVEATTYVAQAAFIDAALRPYDWYRDLVVCGARALGLPREYVTGFAKLDVVKDNNEERRRVQRGFLCGPCLEAE